MTLTPEEILELANKRHNAALSVVIQLLQRHWTFDNNQHHTHNWHDKEEVIQLIQEMKL